MKTRGTKKDNVALVADIKKRFIEAYASCGSITASSKSVRIDRKTVQRWMKVDKTFSKDVEGAFKDNTELLEFTAVKRAINGTDKGSTTLLIFLLNARKPEVYRHRFQVDSNVSVSVDFVKRLDEGRERVRKASQEK